MKEPPKKKSNLNLMMLVVILVGCLMVIPLVANGSSAGQSNMVSKTTAAATVGLSENRNVYADDTTNFKYLYVTVLNSTNTSGEYDGAPQITFNEMNLLNYHNDQKANLEVICQEGDASGPQTGMFGFSSRKANGLIQIRGRSTSECDSNLKSYKIKLYKKGGIWGGQEVIDLNKHPYDLTRVRNKLCFDLFKKIPNMTSLRTRFVILYIKDLSTGNNENASYVNYGMFTQIEAPNSNFLTSHGLDKNGNLYKAQNFEFNRESDIIKDVNESGYDKSDMDSVIKRVCGKNNEKLIKMLDDVNNYSLDINTIVDQDFDRDNYLTWLAANILLGNADTKAGNFYLYSPSNSNKWYFLPWDYDGSLDYYNQTGKTKTNVASWEQSLSNYWGTVLARRFFSDSNNVKQLENKINELSKCINSDTLTKLLKSYYPEVSKQLSVNPDRSKLPSTFSDFQTEYWRIAKIPDLNKTNFEQSIQSPMPFFLGELAQGSGKDVLNWERAFDLQGDDITYEISIAADPAFKNMVLDQKSLTDVSFSFNPLPAGSYYWKVTATDSKGNQQIAFDKVKDENGNKYNGIKEFVIK